MTPLAASDTKISGLPAAVGSIKLAVATGSREIRAMVGASRLLSARPMDAICGENTAGELPPEQAASIASVADAPSAARIVRKIGIKSDYHFYSLWSAPRKVSIIQLVKHSHRACDDYRRRGDGKVYEGRKRGISRRNKGLEGRVQGDSTPGILAVPGTRHNRGNPEFLYRRTESSSW